ncbi:hypothetical protein GA0115240_13221, partial [Streptomyces sp. DvalAA-14]
ALAAGRSLTGAVRAVAGHDLHIETPDEVLLLDTRLTAGWPLRRAGPHAVSDLPTTAVRSPVEAPEPLF